MAAINLVDVLTAAGVVVEAATNWENAGKGPFAPVGIMLHHTAGAKTGDAPSLSFIKNGAPGLSGPLAHILVGRSGKAYVIAANRTNHAGDGASQVLERVKRDEAVTGNAVTNKYYDVKGLNGNGYFYGIEVENTGVGEAYYDVQIQALVKICAAICNAHGWSSNRIIHHRQWTVRKADMSYKGDIPGMTAVLMDSGVANFDTTEIEEAPFPPGVEEGCPQEEQDEQL